MNEIYWQIFKLFPVNFTKAKYQQTLVTFVEIIEFLDLLSVCQRSLMPELSRLIKIILVMPATNAISERSFSALQRVKNI